MEVECCSQRAAEKVNKRDNAEQIWENIDMADLAA